MAHLQKFNAGSAGRIIGHCERQKDKSGEYLKYKTNSKIDPEKTHLNLSQTYYLDKEKNILMPTGMKRLNDILNNTHHLKRKDVNVMCDWVVTLPQDYNGNPEDFFNATISFLTDRYGLDSFVGAYIHNDETTPHLHYCFVPRIYDDRQKRWKVSAKELINKAELRSFHNDLENYLIDKINIPAGMIQNGVTKEIGGNKTPEQLTKINREIKIAQEQLKELRSERAELTSEVATLQEERKSLSSELNSLKNAILSLTGFFEKMKDKIKMLGNDIRSEEDRRNAELLHDRFSDIENEYRTRIKPKSR